MAEFSNAELYRRGAATLLASWEAYAEARAGAALCRAPGITAAVFPHEPESAVYNNALLERDLATTERNSALDAMEDAYAMAGVTRFAAWYTKATRRCAMGSNGAATPSTRQRAPWA